MTEHEDDDKDELDGNEVTTEREEAGGDATVDRDGMYEKEAP